MSGHGPAVLIMARAPRAGEVRRALEPLLGADGCLALQSLLIVRTVEWAMADLKPNRRALSGCMWIGFRSPDTDP